MNEVIVSIGSNCCERQEKMVNAIEWLTRKLSDTVVSDIYETPALGGGKAYLNAVAIGKTDLSSQDLSIMFKSFETDSGRDGYCRKNGIVPIDLDLVKFNDEIIRPKDFKCEYFKIGYEKIRDAN